MENLILVNKGKKKLSTFFIHPIGGQIHWYKEIFKFLDKRITVYAIIDPRLLGKTDEDSCSIKSISNKYFEMIKNTSHSIPRLILGWSFGCEIAYEIAYLFKINNMVDIPILLIDPQIVLKEKVDVFSNFREIIKGEYDFSISDNFSHERFYKENTLKTDEFIEYVLEEMISSGHIGNKLKKYYYLSLLVYLNNIKSFYEYKKEGFIKKITLISAKENIKNNIFSFLRPAIKKDWQQHAELIVNLFFSGDHYSLLSRKTGLLIAEEIKNIIFLEKNNGN